MSANIRAALAAAVLSLTACGGDDGSDKAGTSNPSNGASSATGTSGATRTGEATGTSGSGGSTKDAGQVPTSSKTGACSKGNLPAAENDFYLCGTDSGVSETDGMCYPLEFVRDYTAFRFNIQLHPGSDTDLSSLACLQKAQGLTVSGSSALTDVSALKSFTTVETIDIVDNAKLSSLTGLGGVKHADQLAVHGNASLANFSGLAKGLTLKTLYIEGNASLSSLTGLQDVSVTTDIIFKNNPKLSTCEIGAFAARFSSAKLTSTGNLEATCK